MEDGGYGNLLKVLETWDAGGSQDSMWVTLAEIPNSEHTCSNQLNEYLGGQLPDLMKKFV